MGELVSKYWVPVWAALSGVVMLVQLLLAKTYAKKEVVDEMGKTIALLAEKSAAKESVTELAKEVAGVVGRLEELPNKDELHQLGIDIEGLRGDLKQVGPRLDSLQHMSNLLLENELKEKA